MAQPWRGNVRQLEHVLLNAWIMSDADELGPQDFELAVSGDAYQGPLEVPNAPDSTRDGSAPRSTRSKTVTVSSEHTRSGHLTQRTADEKQRIIEALKACDYNKVKAAKMSGIPRRTFYRRLEAYGIK